MTSTLHEAIAAARAGDMARAQMLAADVVIESPNDPNGWYLLSQLVESDARRAAYLSKTLALAPDHPRARAEFAALPPALVADLSPVAMPEPLISDLDTPQTEEPEIVVADAVVAPVEWLAAPAAAMATTAAGQAPITGLPTPEEMIAYLDAAPLTPEPAAVAAPTVTPDVPEWLQPLKPEPVAMQATPVGPVAPFAPPVTTTPLPPRPAPRPAAPRPAPARRPNTANRALSVLLGLLALLTLAVLVFLIYLLLV